MFTLHLLHVAIKDSRSNTMINLFWIFLNLLVLRNHAHAEIEVPDGLPLDYHRELERNRRSRQESLLQWIYLCFPICSSNDVSS